MDFCINGRESVVLIQLHPHIQQGEFVIRLDNVEGRAEVHKQDFGMGS